MGRLRILVIIPVFFILMNVRLTVGGVEGALPGENENRFLYRHGLEPIIRGAVEDQSWMEAGSREEVHSCLGKYFEGPLLEDLTEKTWDFIKEPTDWYSRARLIEAHVLHCGPGRAVVDALIGIENLDTGHNETGKGLFAMTRTPGGWRISYTAFTWNGSSAPGDMCYNNDAPERYGGF